MDTEHMFEDGLSETFEVTCNGETLPLVEVIKTKVITSVQIGYQTEEKVSRKYPLLGFLSPKKTEKAIEKSILVKDPKGISFQCTVGEELAKIRFWEKKEFEKLGEGYDKQTIFKSFFLTPVHPYQFSFHIGNLQAITWQ